MSSAPKRKILHNLSKVDYRGGKSYSSPVFQFLKPPESPATETFKSKITAAKGEFIFCNNTTEFKNKVDLLINRKSFRQIACTESAIKELLPDTINVSENFSDQTEASITGCECMVAQTGSVVVSTAQTGSRKTFSFAPVHIVVGSRNKLVTLLDDAFTLIAEKYSGNIPSQITFITGPSRTADIEKTLVLGAHGPKELIIFYIDEILLND